MESNRTHNLTAPKLLHNLYHQGIKETEAFISDHIFSYMISGEHQVWIGEKCYTFSAGDFRFFRRNQLTRSIKRSGSSGFASIAIHIDQHTLENLAQQHGITETKSINSEGARLIRENSMLQNFADTLIAYLKAGKLNDQMLQLKTRELVLILAGLDPEIKNALFEFNQPGKIDLQAFMNGHYRYNVPLERFAFLTGRSLSGFKRDFQKYFQTTPARWLIRKRLSEAKYRIEQQKARATEIYLELGFANLSHFSFAYKKAFGNAPSQREINNK